MPGGPEIWIVVLVVVVLFGGSQLPKLARSLGEAKKEFERGSNEDTSPEPKTKARAAQPKPEPAETTEDDQA